MRILYVTTIGGTMTFFKTLINDLVDGGNVVDIATNETVSPVPDEYKQWRCKIYQIDWDRSPIHKGNLKSINQLKSVVTNGNYDIVHCHTPVASAITRIACRGLRCKGLKVIYTAHGFHFYKGAPLINWLVYYPIEKFCSYLTDTLITINHEDYERAKRRMKAKNIEYIPGVGIDVDKFSNTVVDRTAKRRELEIPEDVFLLLSVGELNKNKNHQIVIRALAELNNPNIHYMIAGEGPLYDYLLKLAQKMKVADRVHLLGHRTDVAELYKIADVNVFPSIREGLGLAAIEGMAAGLPLICSDNRGTREYAVVCENAIVCQYARAIDYCGAIVKLYDDDDKRVLLGTNSAIKAKEYAVEIINSIIQTVYLKG